MTRGKRNAVLLLSALAALAAGAWWWLGRVGTESTDDAFLDADVHRIATKVPGRVHAVPVADNQRIAAGDLLAEIDPADYQARLDHARATLELARARAQEAGLDVALTDASTMAAVDRADAGLASAQAASAQQQAERDVARAEAERARADLSRYQALSERAVSRERLDAVQQSAASAAATLAALEQRVAAAQAQLKAAQSEVAAAAADRQRVAVARAIVESRSAEVHQAEAAVREAELALADTRVVAPVAGRVTRKAVFQGGYVGEGQTLMSVVAEPLWVVANFKETQLTDLRLQQPATVYVDALGVRLAGHVDSIQAGTGARFSLLPPENATGNFVKVVQRVPVKIVLDERPPDGVVLGPGMSVVPVVRTR